MLHSLLQIIHNSNSMESGLQFWKLRIGGAYSAKIPRHNFCKGNGKSFRFDGNAAL